MRETQEKPTVLDLFCGEGGAAWGYAQAGFRVIGVDKNHPTNPHATENFVKKLRPEEGHEVHEGDWLDELKKHWQEASLIHASPPCQHYSTARGGRGEDNAEHPDLIYDVLKELEATGKPFIIENVKGAREHLGKDPVLLCGCMPEFDLQVKHKTPRDPSVPLGKHERPAFGLGRGVGKPIVRDCQSWSKDPRCFKWGDCGHGKKRIYRLRRERFFKAGGGWTLPSPKHDLEMEHYRYPTIPVTNGNPSSFYYANGSVGIPLKVKHKIMGIVCDNPDHHDLVWDKVKYRYKDPCSCWMTGKGVAEAIPPAFTRYIGEQFKESREERGRQA